MSGTAQLRIYRIKEGKMSEWLDGWTKLVLPLRRKFGFRIEGAWVVSSQNKFVWIVSYDGPEGFRVRDQEYYASDDRKALHPDPAPLIAEAEIVDMQAVLLE
jgi:hypothetical protein